MTLIEAVSKFGASQYRKCLSPSARYLCWELINLWNKYGRRQFSMADKELKKITGMTEKRISKARQELVKGGIIAAAREGWHQPTKYSFSGVF